MIPGNVSECKFSTGPSNDLGGTKYRSKTPAETMAPIMTCCCLCTNNMPPKHTNMHSNTHEHAHEHIHIHLYGFKANTLYCMYYFPMLQHPIRAILIRAAMEVLALRLEKNTSALAAVITKEQLAVVGIIMFQRMYVVITILTVYYYVLCKCFPGICAHDLQVYSDRCQQTPLIAKIHSCNSGCKCHTHTHAHAHAHALTQEHARTQKNTHTYTHICKYGFIKNMYYSKYCLRMLQPSFRAVLIRAAMGVLALRREKDISALAALITKEKPAIVGIIMF